MSSPGYIFKKYHAYKWSHFNFQIWYQRNLRSVVSVGVSTECVSRVVWRGRVRIEQICALMPKFSQIRTVRRWRACRAEICALMPKLSQIRTVRLEALEGYRKEMKQTPTLLYFWNWYLARADSPLPQTNVKGPLLSPGRLLNTLKIKTNCRNWESHPGCRGHNAESCY